MCSSPDQSKIIEIIYVQQQPVRFYMALSYTSIIAH